MLGHFFLLNLAPICECNADVLLLELVHIDVLLVMRQLLDLVFRDVGKNAPQVRFHFRCSLLIAILI